MPGQKARSVSSRCEVPGRGRFAKPRLIARRPCDDRVPPTAEARRAKAEAIQSLCVASWIASRALAMTLRGTFATACDDRAAASPRHCEEPLRRSNPVLSKSAEIESPLHARNQFRRHRRHPRPRRRPPGACCKKWTTANTTAPSVIPIVASSLSATSSIAARSSVTFSTSPCAWARSRRAKLALRAPPLP